MGKVIVGAVIGLIVSTVAADALKALGVPKHAATIAGGIIGGLA
jgi:hypothetical protein